MYFPGLFRDGVVVIGNKQQRKVVKEYITVNDRIIIVRFEFRPMNLNIVQVYAPTIEADNEEIDTFHTDLKEKRGK